MKKPISLFEARGSYTPSANMVSPPAPPKQFARLKRINALREGIDVLSKEIEKEQRGCAHKHVVKTHGSNTGGYDGPAHDLYWTEFRCPECLKYWTEDGSK